MTDLKPCPYCGGAMRIEGNRDTHKLLGAHDENCIFDTDDHVVQVPATDEQLQFMVSDWNRRATEAEATGKQGVGVPTFECKHVRVKQMSDGKIMVTMITDAFEGAPNYSVQPINPAAVRAAPTPTAPDDVAREQREADYELAYKHGWINCAKWADRVDLVADITSAAYQRDMVAACRKHGFSTIDAAIAASKKGGDVA